MWSGVWTKAVREKEAQEAEQENLCVSRLWLSESLVVLLPFLTAGASEFPFSLSKFKMNFYILQPNTYMQNYDFNKNEFDSQQKVKDSDWNDKQNLVI